MPGAAPQAAMVERFGAQLLTGQPAADPVAVAERLLAVQAQDPRGVRLAIRARTSDLRADDVDRALTQDRSLVVSWLNRGTLHLVRAEDYWWLHALTTPPVGTGNARRLREEGVSPSAAERGVAVVERALADDGPLVRGQLRERLQQADVPVAGQALVHVLVLATLRGLVVRGPVVGGEQAFVLVRDWLGEPPAPLDRDVALGQLARRYLAGHAPADDRDLARWAGVTLRDARRALAGIAAELVERPDGLVALRDRPARAELPPPRLLGPFDPLLLGWVSREPVVGPHRRIVTVNGLFRPFALVSGRAVAVWRLEGGEVRLEPLEPVPDDAAAALRADATDVIRFLG